MPLVHTVAVAVAIPHPPKKHMRALQERWYWAIVGLGGWAGKKVCVLEGEREREREREFPPSNAICSC